MSSEVGQSVGGSDGSEQALPEHQAESGPSSIPSITVTHAAEEAATATETEEMPPPQLAGTVTTVIHDAKCTRVQSCDAIGNHFYVQGDNRLKVFLGFVYDIAYILDFKGLEILLSF
jgi:hypothetical protein